MNLPPRAATRQRAHVCYSAQQCLQLLQRLQRATVPTIDTSSTTATARNSAYNCYSGHNGYSCHSALSWAEAATRRVARLSVRHSWKEFTHVPPFVGDVITSVTSLKHAMSRCRDCNNCSAATRRLKLQRLSSGNMRPHDVVCSRQTSR